MRWLEIVLLLAVLVGVPVVVRNWWRAWHRQHAAARHTYHAAQQDVEAATVFYGSMNLEDERGLYWPAPTRYEVAHEDWHTRTMAELSPEALDSGPGAPSLVPGPAPACPRCGLDHKEPHCADGREWGPLEPETPDPDYERDWFDQHDDWDRPWGDVIALPDAPHERLADTGDIRDAALLADTTTFMRDQDADVADWMARRAAEWARLEIGVLA